MGVVFARTHHQLTNFCASLAPRQAGAHEWPCSFVETVENAAIYVNKRHLIDLLRMPSCQDAWDISLPMGEAQDPSYILQLLPAAVFPSKWTYLAPGTQQQGSRYRQNAKKKSVRI